MLKLTVNKPLKNLVKFSIFTLAINFITLNAEAAVITNNCANINNLCTLSELFGGATIQVGDKLFSEWSRIEDNEENNEENNQRNVNVENIQITGIFQDTNAPGLQFMSINNELSVESQLPIQESLKLMFEFKVTSLEDQLINGSTLKITESSVTPGGSIIIDETVRATKNGNVLANKSVLASPENDDLNKDAVFPPQEMIWITKTISVSGNLSGQATLDKFEQRFSQTTQEPTTALGLLIFGGAGLLSFKKRIK